MGDKELFLREEIMEEVSNEEDEGSTSMQEDDSSEHGDGFDGRKRGSDDRHSSYDADVGIFENIRLENFMSHRLFEFSFGPNVNIISGQNGSGKTAIIAGLQIGLGAKTSSADRGKSVGSYIRRGEQQSTITIRIKNRRSRDVDNRYKADAYGDAVVVERKLVLGGSGGGWCFKDANGRKLKLIGTTPREELTRILDHFNLQVENPIAILTQQKAKQFLSSGKDSDRYKFFMEATGLLQVKSELVAISKVKMEIADILERKKAFIQQIHGELKQLEQRYEDARTMSTLEDHIDELESLWAWTLVAEQEDELAKYHEQINVFNQRIEEHQRNATDAEQEVQTSRGTVEHLNDEITSSTTEMRSYTQRASTFNSELRELKHEQNRLAKEKSACDSSIRDALKRASRLEEGLQTARRQHESSTSNVSDIESTVNEKKSEKKRLEGNISGYEDEIRKRSEEALKLRDDIQVISRDIRKYRALETRAESDANQYRRTGDDSLAKWGRHVPDLDRKIKEAMRLGRFQKHPIGPIGAFVNVKEERWARAIQHSLGNILTSYLVDNSNDQKVLQSLIPRGAYQSIIQTRFEGRYDIPSKSKAPSSLYSIVDAVNISSDPVFNALVDQSEIEKQVLVESQPEAIRLAEMEDPTVRRCWLPDGSQIYSRNSAAVFRSGDKRLAVLLARDMSAQINDLMDQAAEHRHVAENLIAKMEELESARGVCTNKESELSRGLRRTNGQISALENELVHLQSRMDEISSHFDSSSWDQQIRQCREDVENQETNKQRIEERSGSVVQSIEQVKERKAREMKGGVAIEQRLESLKEELDRASAKYRKAMAASSQRETKLQKLEDLKTKAMETVDQFTAKLEKETENATKLAPERIHRSSKSSNELERDIRALKAKLRGEQQKHSGRSLIQIEKEFVEARKRKAKNDSDFRRMEEHLQRVHRGYSARKKKYLRMRHQTKVETNVHFKYFMAKRKHMGELVFDDRGGENGEGTLSLKVALSNHKKKGGGRYETGDMTGLSGGERNYTTFSFMLALGESINIPVRIMDEFDVFMDEQNRRSCYETLVNVSKDMPGRQFVFVSPLQLPNVKPSTRVKIQRLLPPERPGVQQTRMQEFVR